MIYGLCVAVLSIAILAMMMLRLTTIFRHALEVIEKYNSEHLSKLYAERKEVLDKHAIERQQLLDRIQAPSFDHLKQAEVRVIRAQKEEKKEPPIEFV